MNSFLQGESVEEDYPNGFANELQKVTQDLKNSAISSPIDITLYRGSNSDRFAKMQIGDEFTNKSFLSSSNSASRASVFTTPSGKNPIPVLTRLHLKRGVKVIPGNWGEQEIILLPGHTFRVVNKSEVNVQTGWRKSGAVRHYTKTIIVDLELVG